MDIQNVSKIGINYIFRQRKYLGTSIRIQHADLMSERCRQLRLAFCQHLGIHRSQNCWKVTELALILKKMFQSIMKIQGVGKWRDSDSQTEWAQSGVSLLLVEAVSRAVIGPNKRDSLLELPIGSNRKKHSYI